MDENDDLGEGYWQNLMAVKTAVNKVLESKRADGVIGSSLEAEVTLYCNNELLQQLNKLGSELRFALITSTAKVRPLSESRDASESEVDGLEIAVAQSDHAKCARCWHHREEVGDNAAHEELCGRCIGNIEGDGEVRYFV